MDDNKKNYDDSEYEENFRQKEFIIFLIVTNILTFMIAGFIGPRVEWHILAREKSKTYSEKKINEVERFVKENYLREVDEDMLLDGKLKGIFASLGDPYSVYMNKDEFSAFLEDTHGAFGGIGVVVSVDLDKDLIVVVAPIEGTPSEKAGVKAGDYILEINDESYTGDKYKEATKTMRGEPGSKVKIKFARNLGQENEEIKTLEITREEIRTNTVSSEMLKDGVGYIRLTSFDDLSFTDFKKELSSLEGQGLEGIVLDLRNNPGGLLDVTRDIANLFLDKGPIVYTENKNGKVESLTSDNKKVDYPMVVLVNEGSASASEILSGALKDRKRATIVGKQTFGKGVVQRIIDLGDGTGFKLTVSEYKTPNETKIDGIGIIPNILVDLPEDVEVIGPENIKEDTQLQRAVEEVKKKIK